MICSICGLQEAHFHLSMMFNLKIIVVHMCFDCAQKNKLTTNMKNVITEMKSFSKSNKKNKNEDILTIEDFLKEDKEDCKTPPLTIAKNEPISKKEGKKETLTKEQKLIEKQKEIILLEQKMAHLIKQEKYEECIEVKNKIEKLKKGNKK